MASRALASALTAACALVLALSLSSASCSGEDDIHRTALARDKTCYDCHATAYMIVQTPKHAGVLPVTCDTCHSTTAWIPASGGHPENKFPILTGSHSNRAIGCADCHIASLGSDTGGQNCDCVHCHIGAHNTPAIDSAHTGVSGYAGSTPTSPPSCLKSGCHPNG